MLTNTHTHRIHIKIFCSSAFHLLRVHFANHCNDYCQAGNNSNLVSRANQRGEEDGMCSRAENVTMDLLPSILITKVSILKSFTAFSLNYFHKKGLTIAAFSLEILDFILDQQKSTLPSIYHLKQFQINPITTNLNQSKNFKKFKT